MKFRWKKGLAGEQRGAFIVFTALAVWFLLMFVAFAIDFGNYYQHRTRLQNAADAAALAGVAQYADSELIDFTLTDKGKGRLVALPANVKAGAEGQSATFSADNYTFKKLDDVPDDVHQQGLDYVDRNYRRGLGIKEDSMWSATQESTSSSTTQAAGGTTQTTTTTSSSRQICYRVDLEDKISTFFARIFGVNELTVNVSAMAMLDGTESTTVEELLPEISGHINDIIPNYYWESIAKYKSNIYDTSGKKVGTTAAPKKDDPSQPSDQVYGTQDVRYLLSDSKFDYWDIKWGAQKDDEGHLIFGYKDKDKDGNDITDGICAVPIYGEQDLTDNDILTQIFRFEGPESVIWKRENGKEEEIIGLFLDRDNITKSVRSTLFGAKDRFTEIIIGKLASNNSSKINPNVPIYARLESEPVQISNDSNKIGGLTSVCGITFTVTLTESDYNNIAEIKPFVFAYDGPDPNRGDYDAPWIATRAIKKAETPKVIDREYRPGQIANNKEPLLKIVGGNRSIIPTPLVQSSTSTPGPIVVDLTTPGSVFKGAIWAPRSQVTIKGSGKIVGFIAARRIILNGKEIKGKGIDEYGRRYDTSQKISMPALAAFHPEGTAHDYFDYTQLYITDNYNIVYTDFVDWTNKKHLPK